MRNPISFVSGNRFGLFGFLTALGGLLITFFPVLSRYAGLVSPDAMPFFVYPAGTLSAEGLLTGVSFTPHMLYWLLFDPLTTHELAYMVDTLVLTLGGVYYLTGRRVHPLAAWCGGLALGLSGYTFTLFCACAVWAFGLLLRCFETRSLFSFAMLGLVIAWGVQCQPDVLVMVVAVAAAYALWLTGFSKLETGSRRQEMGRRIVAIWPRFGVSVMVLALAGFGGIRTAVTTQMTSRDAQIAGASGQAAQSEAKQGKRSAQEERERWLFATNWSLPPEDALEFVAPGVFGDETMQMPSPYWGRLGRPASEVFQKGRMMPNYRQHTVYLGVIPVMLALFGVVAYFSSRKAKDLPLLRTTADHSDVPFWCGVWAVCLLLAMGRYTPLYRLFYALPYMDYIRAPVKFLHLVELATAFLAGFGVDALLRTGEGAACVRRKLVWLAGGLSALVAFIALVAVVAQPQIVRHITELGLGQVAQALSGYSVQNLLRAAGLAALTAGVAFALAMKGNERWLVWGAALLMVVLVLDQSGVARRYVKVIDVGPFYRENAVIKAVKKSAGGQVINVISYVTPNVWCRDWFSSSLGLNGIRNMMPTAEERATPYGHLFESIQSDVQKLWRTLNVQFVVVPRKGTEALVRAGLLRPVVDFELGAGVLRQVQPSEKSLMLASVAGSVAGAHAFGKWKGGVPLERQADEVAHSETVVTLAPECSSDAKSTASVPRLTEHGAAWGTPWRFGTRLTCESEQPSLLVFNQKFEEGWEVLVDQKAVPCYPADGFWLSAVIPSGVHEVEARKKRNPLPGAMSLGVSLALLVVGVWRGFGCVKATSSGEMNT